MESGTLSSFGIVASIIIIFSFWKEDGWEAGLAAAFVLAAIYFGCR